jgi:hypothetical protein
MSLPQEHRTPELAVAEQKMATFTPEDFAALRPLTDEVFLLIGRYIQSYNFIDFNLRRSIELFWHLKMLATEHTGRYPKFGDAELPLVVSQVVAKMDPAKEDVPTALNWLKQIEHGRPYRNLMGHFAAKRMDDDVLVFASKDERDAERVFGKKLQKRHVLTATTTVAALRELVVNIVAPSSWIAVKYADWAKRYDKL